MKYWIVTGLVGVALFLDTLSYWKQVRKTIKTKRSAQVSTSAFLYKIAKALCAIVALGLCGNFVGVGMEVFMLLIYILTLSIIAKYKPKGWRLF